MNNTERMKSDVFGVDPDCGIEADQGASRRCGALQCSDVDIRKYASVMQAALEIGHSSYSGTIAPAGRK